LCAPPYLRCRQKFSRFLRRGEVRAHIFDALGPEKRADNRKFSTIFALNTSGRKKFQYLVKFSFSLQIFQNLRGGTENFDFARAGRG